MNSEFIVKPKLNKILKERNMTQTQLSQITGIPQGTISKFDRNKQHIDVHLFTIADALKIGVEDLFDVDEQLLLDLGEYNPLLNPESIDIVKVADAEKLSNAERVHLVKSNDTSK